MPPADEGAMEFQAITQVLGVLEGAGMDVVGLDTLSWGNRLAIADPATKTGEDKRDPQRPICDGCVVLAVSPSDVSSGAPDGICYVPPQAVLWHETCRSLAQVQLAIFSRSHRRS